MAELTGVNIQVIPRLPVVPAITLAITQSFPILAGIELKITNEEFVEGNFKLIIKDKLGNPISGVVVKIESIDGVKELTSDVDGYIETRLLDLNTYNLSLIKNGKQVYNDIFYMDYEKNGVLRWEISLSRQVTTFISNGGEMFINSKPYDSENNLIIR